MATSATITAINDDKNLQNTRTLIRCVVGRYLLLPALVSDDVVKVDDNDRSLRAIYGG